ncbi:hypothetical protein LWC35_00345 [Pseudonocardia kujensis]|uniref:hypothetical protein n=1 Tax=Pseudonocardia kujensis TaxID=1128675 RepID=UPI001E4C0776|nr:hypothetical protein [Pseudonocardia kujensis]MCE0761375.1 hypothetical protein [Pseudonocardia kujensis]
MTAELTDPARSPDPGASAVHLLDVASASALLRRPGREDLPTAVGWGVLVLPVFGADPELSVEFGDQPDPGPEGDPGAGAELGDGAPSGPRWLACADLRRVRHDVVTVRGLLRAGPALAAPAEVPPPPEGAAHRVQGVFRMRPLPGRRIEIRLAAALAPAGGVEPGAGAPARLELRGTFAR